MYTIKEKFLSKIADQIKVLQDAYNYNKGLPDYIFESMDIISPPIVLPTANVFKPENGTHKLTEIIKDYDKIEQTNNNLNRHQELEYGTIKRSILKIIQDNGKGILKRTIIEKMIGLRIVPEADVVNVITNGLANLNSEGIIKGYKPAGLKFRGYFWTLSDWWITDYKTDKMSLPIQYEPYSGKLKQL